MIKIYTDGACSGNPGIGGWGCVIIKNDEKPIFLNGGENYTTNNRMELVAAIKGLNYFREENNITIVTDSKYLKDGIESWIENWKKNGKSCKAKISKQWYGYGYGHHVMESKCMPEFFPQIVKYFQNQ